MSKKTVNLGKLETEIALQESKLRSLRFLREEILAKIGRLQKQLEEIDLKAQRLSKVLQQNKARYQQFRK